MVHSSADSYPERFHVRLTLLVPELIWPEPNDQSTLGKPALPGLEWLAGHAAFENRPRQSFEAALAAQFDLEDAPFAPLRLLGEGHGPKPDEAHWLCADPVHLRFHHERIILADAGAFDLETEEAEAIVASLNSEFGDIGRFHVATARRWYLRLDSAVAHQAEPISKMAGRRIDGELKDTNGPLTRWLNEVQMYLHGHPVNEHRQAAGKPAVNSLWLWGGGSLPAVEKPACAALWSDNPLAAGLAMAGGIAAQPCPANLADFLDKAAESRGNHLVVLDTLLSPALYEDGPGWRTSAQKLEADWFAPLSGGPGRRLAELSIVAPTVYGQLSWTLGGKERWKFWRKSRPLAALALDLAEGNPA